MLAHDFNVLVNAMSHHPQCYLMNIFDLKSVCKLTYGKLLTHTHTPHTVSSFDFDSYGC